MDGIVLEQLVAERFVGQLSDEPSRERFRLCALRLADLPDRADEIGEFLAEFASLVADLFAAHAVAIWFRGGTGLLHRKVDVGWSHLRLDATSAAAHTDLVDGIVTYGKSVIVAPYAAPFANEGVRNPTDAYLLIAPLRHSGDSVAALELVLGPNPLRRTHSELRRSYMDWLAWLSDVAERGISRLLRRSETELQLAHKELELIAERVAMVQEQIRCLLQTALQEFAGRNFGSLAANRDVAKQVHTLLDSKGLRVVCPECGSAAILRCQDAGNSRTGAFVFDHYLDAGRTFHGGPTTFPALQITPKPPRRRPSVNR